MIFKKHYYGLVAGLPDIQPEDRNLTFNQQAFKEVLFDQCTGHDIVLLKWLLYQSDNDNLIRTLYKKEPLSETGNFSKEYLEEIVEGQVEMPGYMRDFMGRFREYKTSFIEEEWRNTLTTMYYRQALQVGNPFLQKWLDFELKLKTLVVAINAKTHGLELENAIVEHGDFTEQLLGGNLRDLDPDEAGLSVGKLVNAMEGKNLLVKEKYLDDLRWNWLDEHTFFHYFTMEKLLAYYIKLGVISRWLKLDESTGRELLYKMLDSFRGDLQFPEIFAIKKRKN